MPLARLGLAALLLLLVGCIPEIENPFIAESLPPDRSLAGPWVTKWGQGGTLWLDVGAGSAASSETAVLVTTQIRDGKRLLSGNVFRIRRAGIGGRAWFEAESVGPDPLPEPWNQKIQRFFGRYEVTPNGELRIVFPSLGALKEAIEAGRIKGDAGGYFAPRIMLRDEPSALRAFLASNPPPDGETFIFTRAAEAGPAQ